MFCNKILLLNLCKLRVGYLLFYLYGERELIFLSEDCPTSDGCFHESNIYLNKTCKTCLFEYPL